ncbi:MAG TPA: hypothetical protein VEQ58_01320, partial [Polyangiaceae bacterium]|nr:hypothetical protein [Polyangiaceae bacterium]
MSSDASRHRWLGARLLLTLAAAASLAFGQAPTSAAPPPLAETLTGSAKNDYDTALLLYKSGDFSGAEQRFASAYRASRDVRLLWNSAACEQGQRHYAK